MSFLITHRGKSAIELLEYHGIYQYFTECITKEYNFKRKPSPDSIIYLMEKYNLNRDDIIVVGDRKVDIETAINAYMQSVYVDFDESKEELEIANYNIKNINELISIFKRNFGDTYSNSRKLSK